MRADMVQDSYVDTSEWREVVDVADSLTKHLSSAPIAARLDEANQPRQASGVVQATFIAEAKALGFADESKGLFSSYGSRLRPDYYRPVGTTGIILEVERGKTTDNNMDLLDMWKCHICDQADYLFLMVPIELRQHEDKGPRREYVKVERRLRTFFQAGNYTNVRGLVLIGY